MKRREKNIDVLVVFVVPLYLVLVISSILVLVVFFFLVHGRSEIVSQNTCAKT